MVLIPAAAYGGTFYMDDKDGRPQFLKSLITNTAVTFGLKLAVDKERPDKSDDNSFPSGHTSTAFQGAAFIHKRYGFKYSLPAYAGAVSVGYTRVQADKHHIEDVLAGAAIGFISSWYFTTPYENVSLAFFGEGGAYGVSITARW